MCKKNKRKIIAHNKITLIINKTKLIPKSIKPRIIHKETNQRNVRSQNKSNHLNQHVL